MTPRRENLLAAEIAARLAGCPSAEDLQRFHDRSVSDSERGPIEEHMAGCAACRAGLAVLAQAPDDLPAPQAEFPATLERQSETLIEFATEVEPPALGRRRPLLWAGASATVVVMALVLAAIWISSTERHPVERSSTEASLQPIAPRGSTAAPPRVLRWTADPRASRYRIVLGGAGLTDRTIETRDAVPSLELDARIVSELRSGVDYVWSVAALGPTGVEIDRSEKTRFRINARAP